MFNKNLDTYAYQYYTAYYLNREADTLACKCTYHESGNREQE